MLIKNRKRVWMRRYFQRKDSKAKALTMNEELFDRTGNIGIGNLQ